MSSFRTQVQEHVSSVFLNTNHFAEEVIQNRRGIDGEEESVTALWDEDPPQREQGSTQETERTGTLKVPSSVTIHEKDVWEIRGKKWTVTEIHDDVNGLVPISVHRRDKGLRTNTRVF